MFLAWGGIMNTSRYLKLYTLAIIPLLLSCTAPQAPSNPEKPVPYITGQHYIARCLETCDSLITAIRLSGGTIEQQYVNINAISFQLNPQSNIDNSALSRFPIYKDINVSPPLPIEKYRLPINKQIPKITSSVTTDKLNDFSIKNYSFNNRQTGAATAHQNNIIGQDIIVAIIDSGTANNPEIVPVLTDSVIGGENFVPEENEPSATSTKNDEHGTWVGSMIAANGTLTIVKTNELAQAIMSYAPESVTPINEAEIEVPMIGSAPGAKLYALKTFGFDGSGAPSSRIIAAMDRVLTLKTNFNNGIPSEPVAGDGSEENPFVYDSLNIQVLNLSLGGPALFPGREIEDLLSDALVEAGIVVVASAGNEGFAAITGGSPGTGIGSIAVGASNDPVHERILREVQLGVGVGIQFRPTDFQQIASFSSRGPTADGRNGVDIVANGRASFVQGADGHIGLVSGTSFSAPTVAGASALLWSVFPQSTATEIKNALIEGANPNILPPTTSQYDQGHGFLDINESLEILEEKEFENHLPTQPNAEPNSKVVDNIIRQGIEIIPAQQLEYERNISLSPGQVSQFFVETDLQTTALTIEVEDILPSLPPDQQNALFTDDLIVTVVDAPLSIDETRLLEFISTDQEFIVPNPQTGLVRVAVMGDWTNVGNISAEISIERNLSTFTPPQVKGSIAEGESHQFTIDIDPTITTINLGLYWIMNWAYYPSHDLDLIVIDPDGNLFFEGATLASPEIMTIEAPISGTWTVIVEGFLLHDMQDDYQLLVTNQNGTPLISTP